MNALGTILRDQLRRQALPLASAAALVLFNAALAVVPPVLVGRIVDALTRSDGAALLTLVLAYVAIVPLAGASNALEYYIVARFAAIAGKQVRLRIAESLVAGNLAAVRGFSMGEVVNRIGGDIDQIEATVNAAILPSISALVAIAAATGAMLFLDRRLALISFAGVLLTALTVVPGRRRLVAVHRDVRLADDALAATITDRLNVAAIVRAKTLSLLAQVTAVLGHANDGVIAATLRSLLAGQWLSAITAFSSSLGPAAILLFGGYLVAHHQCSVGVIVTFLSFHARLAGGFGQVNALQNQLAVVRVSSERIEQLLRIERESGGSLPFVPGDVVFRNAGVTYASTPLFEAYSDSILDGDCTAITGESGSGKSTLASLIPRLLEPSAGTVLIGGVDVSAFELGDLRRHVILVPSESSIPSGTLDDIIGEVSRESIDNAMRMVELLDLTPSAQLSAGERQRLSLVAAIVRQPSILILDEATSAVDEAMEIRILSRLRRCVRTLIVITHRSSTLSVADRVLRVPTSSIGSVCGVRQRPRRAG